MNAIRPLDASFLEVEDADDNASLAFAAIAVLGGPAPSRAEFTATMGKRLGKIPHATQVLHRTPMDLTLPEWVETVDTDLSRHVHRVAVPAPGTDTELFRLIADLMAIRLDPTQPLWECWIIESLADGRWALLMKIHHSMADGISAIRLFESLCDPLVAPTDPVPVRHTTDEAHPTASTSILGSSLRALARTGSLVSGAATLVGRVLRPSAPSPLNGPITRRRRYGVARATMTEIQQICDGFDVTVNDVALTVVGGALRNLLLRRGREPGPETIRSLVPVSYRSAGAKAATLDNRISLTLPYLPVDVADPIRRLRTVHARMSGARTGSESGAGHLLTDLAGLLPFAPLAWGLRLLLSLPQHSVAVVTTNVPGPHTALRLLDRPVLELFPYVPIAVRLRLGVAIMSYAGHLAFGVTGDFDAVPEVQQMCADIESEIRALQRKARTVTTPHPAIPPATWSHETSAHLT